MFGNATSSQKSLSWTISRLTNFSQANLFYCGCVIVELRDFRRSSSTDCDLRYTLLRPTPHVSHRVSHSRNSSNGVYRAGSDVCVEFPVPLHPACIIKQILFQSLLCDINQLTNDGHRWTEEDKFNLESQLILYTSEPLCLDPSPTVFHVTSVLHNQKHTYNTKALKR